jgi:hypothetical protein
MNLLGFFPIFAPLPFLLFLSSPPLYTPETHQFPRLVPIPSHCTLVPFPHIYNWSSKAMGEQMYLRECGRGVEVGEGGRRGENTKDIEIEVVHSSGL